MNTLIDRAHTASAAVPANRREEYLCLGAPPSPTDPAMERRPAVLVDRITWTLRRST